MRRRPMVLSGHALRCTSGRRHLRGGRRSSELRRGDGRTVRSTPAMQTNSMESDYHRISVRGLSARTCSLGESDRRPASHCSARQSSGVTTTAAGPSIPTSREPPSTRYWTGRGTRRRVPPTAAMRGPPRRPEKNLDGAAPVRTDTRRGRTDGDTRPKMPSDAECRPILSHRPATVRRKEPGSFDGGQGGEAIHSPRGR